MIHRSLLVLAVAALYYSIATIALVSTAAGSLLTALVLFGAPTVLLLWQSNAPKVLILHLVVISSTVGVLLQGFAHAGGVWFMESDSALRLFSFLPIEAVLVSAMQAAFLVVLYEVLFDDCRYSTRTLRERLAATFVLAIGGVAILFFGYIVTFGFATNFLFWWLLFGLVAPAIAALLTTRNLSVALIDRLVDFSLVSAVPLALSLFVALANSQLIYSGTSTSLQKVFWFHTYVPIEALALLFLFPFTIAVLYELYLDDGI